MHSLPDPSLPPATPTPHELAEVAAGARALRDAADAGQPQAPLRGKHLALICTDDGCTSARAFTTAAEGLGARVSRLQPDAALLAEGPSAAAGARMLGRLYDAVAFGELAPTAAARLQRTAGVPVFRITPAADDRAPAARPADDPYLLQAWLLHALRD